VFVFVIMTSSAKMVLM